jgi:hypothetical protein
MTKKTVAVAQSRADRALAERNAERGLTKVAVWVPERDSVQLKAYARKLRDEYLNGLEETKVSDKLEKPNPNIARLAKRYDNLKMQVNIGQRHRFTLSGIRGSLWVVPQADRYFVKFTGDVASRLWPAARQLGTESEDDGYPVVYVDTDVAVGKCLGALAESA